MMDKDIGKKAIKKEIFCSRRPWGGELRVLRAAMGVVCGSNGRRRVIFRPSGAHIGERGAGSVKCAGLAFILIN